MPDVFILAAVRTPIGRFGGSLAAMTATDLGTAATTAALARAGVPPGQVDQVLFGQARQAGNGPNPARQVGFRSGIPETVPATTVNKACGSGLKSVMMGLNEIRLGQADVVVAGGIESMSRVPYLVENARWGLRLGHQELTDGMYRDGFHCMLADQLMGETAETLAAMHQISREEQDEYALHSQQRAGAAQADGRFADELVPVEVPVKRGQTETLSTDEHVRADVTLEKMAKLPPVFSKTGTVTAGNSSGITDGAAVTILASEAAVQKHGLTPLARIVDYAVAGVDPKIMGIGPVPATRKLLARTGMKLDDFGLVELNEAFAAQVLACLRELPIDRDRLNVNGGAIALGHPIGCTGTRILTTLVHEMQKRDVKNGLVTLCISGGMGISMAVEGV
jgi:acetyl-CoA C-acetyltransferase